MSVAALTRIMSVDGFQANQSDVIVLVTSRSTLSDSDSPILDFIQDPRRTCVALSRARHGLIIIGNLRTLRRGAIWNKYFTEALKTTHAVDSDKYLSLLQGEEVDLVPVQF